MGKIIIVGLGPDDYESLTLRTLRILESAKCLILRTEKHPLIKDLKEKGIKYQSCDDIYDSSENFEEVYKRICFRVLELAKKNEEVVYAVPGHPFVAEKSVQLIIQEAGESNSVQIESAVSFIDIMSTALKIDISSGLKIIDGLELGEQKPDMDCGNIITQVYSRFILSDIKLKLMDYYKDDQEICIVRIAEGIEELEWIKLYEMDKIKWVDYLTSIYIPAAKKNKRFKDMEDLKSIIEMLRGDNGCSWDKKQNHQTLKPFLLEECYEVIDAIDEENMEFLAEELGDVLLQVVLHAQIGSESGEFDLNEIITKLVEKLIRRHPHIFDESFVHQEGSKIWDQVKRKEKGIEKHTETLISIPKGMPSLMRSFKIQEKAASVGFDWDNVDGAMAKVDEELLELKEVYKTTDYAATLEELGDLLFAVVNVARFLNIQPELALKATIEKFINRFEIMEEMALSLGKNLDIMTLHEMDLLWNKAKTHNFTINDKN